MSYKTAVIVSFQNIKQFEIHSLQGSSKSTMKLSVFDIGKLPTQQLQWQLWNSRPPASVILCWVSWVENVLLIYYASSDLFVCLHWKCLFTLKKTRFTAFLDGDKQTDRQTDRRTNAGDSIIPRFRRDNKQTNHLVGANFAFAWICTLKRVLSL